MAVFVDGCFWHGCADHLKPPKANASWWAEKLDRNKARDLGTTALLEALGWNVLRVWEHVPVPDAVSVIERALNLQISTEYQR